MKIYVYVSNCIKLFLYNIKLILNFYLLFIEMENNRQRFEVGFVLCKDNLIQLFICICIFICNSVVLFYFFVNFIVGKIMDI